MLQNLNSGERILHQERPSLFFMSRGTSTMMKLLMPFAFISGAVFPHIVGFEPNKLFLALAGMFAVYAIIVVIYREFFFAKPMWTWWNIPRYFARKLVFTNQRLICKVSAWKKENRLVSIPYTDIVDVKFEQSVSGRIFNYGTVYIQEDGIGGTYELEYVSMPRMFRKRLMSQVSKYRDERTLSV